jgi:hypothetical protein
MASPQKVRTPVRRVCLSTSLFDFKQFPELTKPQQWA